MITYKTSDLIAEDVEALVNTVNCVGVMGRGIALQFKKTFPDNFTAYAEACKQGEVVPGKMFIYDTFALTNPRYIVNFPTKRHWKGKSRIEDVETGLNALISEIKERGIRSIAIPPLGSGLGGLSWIDVKPLIEYAVQDVEDLEVVIFEPRGAPDAKVMARNIKVPKMTEGRASLVSLMRNYLAGLLDPQVSLLELHKLMYFMQESGQNLKLKYSQAEYGPYAANLRHVLNAIEGHLVSGYADGGDTPHKLINLVPGAVEDASSFLKDYPDANAHLDNVIDLVEGFESPFGLELLSTVHWVVNSLGASSLEETIATTHAWNNHKKQFSERQIEIAYKVLKSKGWFG